MKILGILKNFIDQETDVPIHTDLLEIKPEFHYQFKLAFDGGLMRKVGDRNDPNAFDWEVTWEGHRFFDAHQNNEADDLSPAGQRSK